MTVEPHTDSALLSKVEPIEPVESQPTDIEIPEEPVTSFIALPDTATYSPPEFLHLYTALETSAFDLDGPTSVAYNGLAQDGLSQDRPFVLGVTSAVPGEGKTTTATHLALTMAMNSYKRICLIDFSLSEVTYGDIATRLGLYRNEEEGDGSPRIGVVDVLEESANAVPTYQLADPNNLTVIPRGKSAKRPAKISRSPRIKQLLSSARHAFDVIIIDLPAVSTENALPLSKHCDGILIVVQAGTTPRDIVHRAIAVIGRTRIVGVALNRQKSSVPNWLVKLLRL
jgi:protein-tyrosine kinase